MKAEYKRDLQDNYLILKAADGAEEGYRLHMAEQNEIPGLLSFSTSRTNGELFLYYKITSKQQFGSLYEQRFMNYHDILLLLSGIRDVLENVQKYLLDPSKLVFDPEYIYVGPQHGKLYFCYLPGDKEERPLSMLTEFILKRLDHQDRNAVVLGYSFYQSASEENFNLHRTLRELLKDCCEGKIEEAEAAPDYNASDAVRMGTSDGCREYKNPNDYNGDENAVHPIDEQYEVVHKKRKRKKGTVKKADKLFQIIHPAVLLSGLFLCAALEILFYLGMFSLTETGGLFFLIISAEMLANKWILGQRKKKAGKEKRWAADEEQEEGELYRKLFEEMYENPKCQPEAELTQILGAEPQEGKLRLIYLHSDHPEAFPDICIESLPVCVGRKNGEADILVDSPTVSRLHARLERQNGKYFIKDLNSRNGTFCNGYRLQPQERKELADGDRIAFAQIEYQAAFQGVYPSAH